jgi:hypothetical protein
MHPFKVTVKFGGTRAALRFGRDLAYAPFTAELLVAGSAPEVRMGLHGAVSTWNPA